MGRDLVPDGFVILRQAAAQERRRRRSKVGKEVESTASRPLLRLRTKERGPFLQIRGGKGVTKKKISSSDAPKKETAAKGVHYPAGSKVFRPLKRGKSEESHS